MTLRPLPTAVALLLAAALVVDRIVNFRTLDLLAAPAAAAALMLVAAVADLASRRPVRSGYGVAPLTIFHRGNWYGFVVAVPLALVAPRLGLPYLAFLVARYRRASLTVALAVAAAASAMIETMLATVITISIPLLPF